ncbi:MAG: hydroxyisourate hydrolase [Proteobacteria bacterium]|nr:hydroxyisourate hydrolase [Pseudomonadota bacterium]MDA0883378.1 hydroxyisourate hydrolase [Pseudomonadota bacterium]MDA1149579.1 hydroxyisourate hydrolase [Pseudomonadota bacterium]
MGRLTTHVLDTARGSPASDLSIDLFRLDGDEPVLMKTTKTNDDGRCDAPLLDGDALQKGRYQLLFKVSAYLRRSGDDLPEIPFLDDVVINFGINDPTQHHHVPLLLSAYGYSTYRGS